MGHRVPGTRHLVPDTRYLTRSDAEGRTPGTEDRARPPENTHTGYASCIHLLVPTAEQEVYSVGWAADGM
jgi:hypothetical protein